MAKKAAKTETKKHEQRHLEFDRYHPETGRFLWKDGDRYGVDSGLTWEPTPQLRWLGKELQQAWRCVDTGDFEWRTLPGEFTK